jgi:bifunctional DNA-binding transcriptional regulator/antitoxin component of YhaV-PrlF toxin-antitoxin module
MSRILFDTKLVQKHGRVVITRVLLDNLNLREGDEVDLFFDSKDKAVVITKAQNDSRINQ